MEKKLNVDWDFCLKITAVVIFLYFLYLLKNIIIWIVFAIVLAMLFNYIINFLEKKKIPRVVGVIITYFGLFSIAGLFFYWAAPVFLEDLKIFARNLPEYLGKISPVLEKAGIKFLSQPDSLFTILQSNLEKAGEGLVNALSVIFGGIQATLFIIFLAFFLSLEKDFLEKFLANFSPGKYKSYLFHLLPRAKKQVNSWFISRLIGMFFVGLLCFVVLEILNVEYSFILGLFFGITDLVPIIGPIFGGVIIAILVMMDSVTKALFVLAALIVIQQLEGNVLFPILFKKFAHLPPALVLIALVVGAKLWGLLGAILAIPLAGIIFELIKDYLNIKRKRKEKESLPSEA